MALTHLINLFSNFFLSNWGGHFLPVRAALPAIKTNIWSSRRAKGEYKKKLKGKKKKDTVIFVMWKIKEKNGLLNLRLFAMCSHCVPAEQKVPWSTPGTHLLICKIIPRPLSQKWLSLSQDHHCCWILHDVKGGVRVIWFIPSCLAAVPLSVWVGLFLPSVTSQADGLVSRRLAPRYQVTFLKKPSNPT